MKKQSRPLYHFFNPPLPDKNLEKVIDWQSRSRGLHIAMDIAAGNEISIINTLPLSTAPQERNIYLKFFRFTQQMVSLFNRDHDIEEIARAVAKWLQKISQMHYIEDGDSDYWPTIDEIFLKNGDDCDGLELLSFTLLSSLAPDIPIYRAVICPFAPHRSCHLVTFIFTDPQKNDPLVVDPTGNATTKVIPFSKLRGWWPQHMFSYNERYSPR